jgi:hypothetical protein
MRAILPLLMVVPAVVTGACSQSEPNILEFNVAVNAPGAASVVVDGNVMIAPAGGTYSRGYPSLAAAMKVSGAVDTRNADATLRATSLYTFGGYCTGHQPLLRQTERFVESADAAGTLTLALDSIQCELTDGTGVIVQP